LYLKNCKVSVEKQLYKSKQIDYNYQMKMKMAKQLILANNHPLGKLLKKTFKLKQQINVRARSGRTLGRTDARTNTEQNT